MRNKILIAISVILLSSSIQAQVKETPLKLIVHSDFLNVPLSETSEIQYNSGLGLEYRLSQVLSIQLGFDGLYFMETNGSKYTKDSFFSIGAGFSPCNKCKDAGIQLRYMSSFSSLFSLDNSSFELGYRNGISKNAFVEGGFKYFTVKNVDYLNEANLGMYFKIGLLIGIGKR